MAHNNVRLPLRNRTGPQRTKIDENATSRHVRQSSTISIAGASRVPHVPANVPGFKNGPQRAALNEVTTIAVNRKETGSKFNGKDKDVSDAGLKRSRSSSLAAATGPQRVPIGPGRGSALAPSTVTLVHARVPASRIAQRQPYVPVRAVPRAPAPSAHVPATSVQVKEVDDDSMEVEEPQQDSSRIAGDQEVEAMVGPGSDIEDDSEDETEVIQAKPQRIWPQVATDRAHKYQREVEQVRETFIDCIEVDPRDTTMVSEYSEEIFEYMNELEDSVMPNPDYMDGQTEINWTMRQTLVDWLLQVHLRYHLLPETLWIAVNIVDRFLTKRVVSLVKLQLVGVTAMFIAAKYEEILAPSIDEFVFLCENGYTKEEILKGERIVLQTLEFKISHYCSPYSWMRRISKADNYDIQTRTLSKFLIEITLLDNRFLRVKPSLVAAVGMYTARRMLGGDWNEGFVFYSGSTEEHLLTGYRWLVEKLAERNVESLYVCKKYAHKKFLKASSFAIEWAKMQYYEEGSDDMLLTN